MNLSVLDDTLLHLLARTRGHSVKEKIDNFFKIPFSLGNFIVLFGVVFLLIGFLPLPFTRLFESEQLDTKFKLCCFFLVILVGGCLSGFSIWLKEYSRKLVYKNATIEINKMKEKEIYNADSDIDLAIYIHNMVFDDAGIFTKESFPHIKLLFFKNERITIKVRKGEQERTVGGGLVEFIVKNEEEIKNEIATWNVSEEVLVYKIEKVIIFPEFIEKHYSPLPILEIEEKGQTKIFLTASIDEELVKQFYDKKALDELLAFIPYPFSPYP